MLTIQCLFCYLCYMYMCVWYGLQNIETLYQICLDSSKSIKSVAFR